MSSISTSYCDCKVFSSFTSDIADRQFLIKSLAFLQAVIFSICIESNCKNYNLQKSIYPLDLQYNEKIDSMTNYPIMNTILYKLKLCFLQCH
jgi:hypothetical protein